MAETFDGSASAIGHGPKPARPKLSASAGTPRNSNDDLNINEQNNLTAVLAMNPMHMNQAQRNELERLNPPPAYRPMRMNASNSIRANTS